MRNSLVFVFFSVFCFIAASCHDEDMVIPDNQDYKQQMRSFVTGISRYAKAEKPGFVIIPQNGIELVTLSGKEGDVPATDYLNAIDGNGQEDLLFGYDNDNEATPVSVTLHLKTFLNISKNAGNTILVTDYCRDTNKIQTSYAENEASNYISFAADHRALNDIPAWPATPYNQNSQDILQLREVKNFLYLINPENFTTKDGFLQAVKATNYDLIIMDLFFNDGTAFSAAEIAGLKTKSNGGKRLVICYLSIGEAEDYRYYWKADWKTHPPLWLDGENPDWPGNYKVKYWDPQWQAMIYGNDSSYLYKILAAGFDGAYLDIVDAFEYYEAK